MLDTKTTKKLIELKNLVEGAEISLQQARQVLDQLVSGQEGASLAGEAKALGSLDTSEEGQVIEGIFDGQNMVGPDGKKYSVPANYASKSKMVEGDKLKLTITPDGSFVYKQVQPLERERITGKLMIDEETGDYRVLADGKSYKVLSASITYFKGEPGDSVTILIAKDKESSWAAVENVFKIDQEALLDKQENDLSTGDIDQEKKEATATDSGSEFLKPESSGEEQATEEPQLGATNSSQQNIDHQKTEETVEDTTPTKQTEDIFANTNKKVDTGDLQPASTPEPIDDLDKKDSQGLEEI